MPSRRVDLYPGLTGIERKRAIQKVARERNADKCSARNKEYREKNKESLSVYAKQWREDNRDHSIAQQAEYRERNAVQRQQLRQSKAGALLNKRLLKEYGISLVRRDEMLEEQGGCAICRAADPGGKYWHVDHDHVTGVVRGILCHNCNVGLGHFRDNIERLQWAIDYLKAAKHG